MKTAEEIAASLPSGQRAYLLGQLPNISHASARQVQGRLRRNGLWDSLINRPTPLGLRVRAILQKDQPNG